MTTDKLVYMKQFSVFAPLVAMISNGESSVGYGRVWRYGLISGRVVI
jgi:hypothetical protein